MQKYVLKRSPEKKEKKTRLAGHERNVVSCTILPAHLGVARDRVRDLGTLKRNTNCGRGGTQSRNLLTGYTTTRAEGGLVDVKSIERHLKKGALLDGGLET